MSQPDDGGAGKVSKWATTAKQYQEKARQHQEELERKHRWVAFPLESFRRFNKIEGKHLAIVISLNMFVAIIPLIIIGYSAVIVHTVLSFFLRNWFGEYGRAYGGFGVSLALAAAVGIIASFWVWIAAVMGVWWEHKAGPAVVAQMEELSAEISAS